MALSSFVLVYSFLQSRGAAAGPPPRNVNLANVAWPRKSVAVRRGATGAAGVAVCVVCVVCVVSVVSVVCVVCVVCVVSVVDVVRSPCGRQAPHIVAAQKLTLCPSAP